MLLLLWAPLPSLADAVRPAPVAAGEFLVGSERGLEVWSVDGELKRTIVRRAAPHPRWLDAEHVLVIEGADSAGDPDRPVVLSRVNLVEGSLQPIAKVTPVRCRNEKRSAEIPVDMFALREEDDFVVDQAADRACLTIGTGPGGMTVFVTFGLQSGTARQIVTVWDERCQLPAGTAARIMRQDEFCQPRAAISPPVRDRRFFFRNGALFEQRTGRHDSRLVGRLPTYIADAASPSGRWLLLSGEFESEDSVHRKLAMVDTKLGQVFALSREPGKWPEPIGPDTRKRFRIPESAFVASGESNIRWIGTDEHDEALVVDDVVFRPGVRVFSVNGNVAR